MVDNRTDTLNTINKVLIVFFIISIFIMNFVLTYKKIKREGLKYSPHRMIIMSLAFGDIYLAVFSLTVKAAVIFEGTDHFKACDLYKAIEVYQSFLIHFVYGTGLALLSLELIIAYKLQHPYFDIKRNKIMAISYSLLHWIAGLVIVPALTMYGTTKSTAKDGLHINCFDNASPARLIAMYAVSVILPGALAVIVSIVVLFDSIHYRSKVAGSSVPTPEEKIDPSFSVATAPLAYQKKYLRSRTHVLRSRMLCVVSFLFVLCVFPQATHRIMSALFSKAEIHGVFYHIFLWMSLFRSVATPLFLILCDTDED